MYSGLLPKGLTEDDLSPDEEEDAAEEEREGEKRRVSAEKLSSAGENTAVPPTEAPWTHTASDGGSDPATSGMPGVSHEMWQKFQDLRKKNDEMKTIKDPRRKKRRRHKKGTESQQPTETSERLEEREKHWNDLEQHFGANDRFDPPACSKPPPKSGLEKSIETAIAEGDIAKAEEMSDRLATRELAVKIAQAADCRDFVRRKQEEDALRAAQKRKNQTAWGFEAKRRWETKSNMGFM
ncbi:protein FAM204A isoform X2 [Gasterosteus aculeatus]|uniref:protein FAM204A isoform X2 n=1 Tax=Gasterosteus aculeatus aculeatus TaxID=481459 RepID=UPI001A9A0EB1|nr:protein FAM204A isoform X2 [Gasterosteus aculeatus aculeatus]